jgi:hypothetical protein
MTIKVRNFAPTIVAGALLALFAANASAQGVSVYSPISSEYRIGDFVYSAPQYDGWRQVTSAPGMFILVYAESVADGQLNTRIQIVAESHEIPEESREFVEDSKWLSRQSYGQQRIEREDRIVAFSPIEAVGDSDLSKFTIVTSAPDGSDMFESFYVKLAPDHSSYLIAKMTTIESDFQEQDYLKQLEDSLAGIRVDSAEPATDRDGDADKEGEAADDSKSEK